MKIIASLAVAAALAVAVPAIAQTMPKAGAAKMSQADCTAAWTKLDASKAGTVTQVQAQGVVTDFKAADSNNDGKLSKTEFTSACEKGLVTASASSGSGARGMTGNESSTQKK